MFRFSLCFRGIKKFLSLGFFLVVAVWGLTSESDADSVRIFFSTDLIASNPVKFGSRSFRNIAGQSAALKYSVAKASFQYPKEKKERRTDFRTAGLGRFRVGDEVHSVISRKNAQRAKTFIVSEFGKSGSRIRGKNMTVTKMRQGDKVVSMDVMIDGTREELRIEN